jgi:hypothetical protein
VRAGVLGAPRPMPGRLGPAVAGSLVVALALPVFLLAGWRVSGWALGAVLWAGAQSLGLVVARVRAGAANLAAASVLAFGMMFRAIAVMVVLIALAASDVGLAVAAGLVYGLAYTVELGLSIAAYFGAEPRA